MDIFDSREHVRQAALYMDEVKPGWWKNIDPIRLDLREPKRCICGQNDLSWMEHTGLLWARLGFRTHCFSDPALEPFWLEEIAQRMPSPTRERVVTRKPDEQLMREASADADQHRLHMETK